MQTTEELCHHFSILGDICLLDYDGWKLSENFPPLYAKIYEPQETKPIPDADIVPRSKTFDLIDSIISKHHVRFVAGLRTADEGYRFLDKGAQYAVLDAHLIDSIISKHHVRFVAGLRTADEGYRFLDKGAQYAVLDAHLIDEIKQLPRERVYAVVMIDTEHGDVSAPFSQLWQHVSGFIVHRNYGAGGSSSRQNALTSVLLVRLFYELKQCIPEGTPAAQHPRLLLSGGIDNEAEIKNLSTVGADGIVGSALMTGALPAADLVCATLTSDRADGLYTTVVVDEAGVCLGLVYSNKESIAASIAEHKGIYHSRKRGLWRKGDTSGASQDLLRIQADCDNDTLRFTVHQNGAGFCHLERWTCFDEAHGIPGLMRTLAQRLHDAPAGSYTKRLFDDDKLLTAKLHEEADELMEAVTVESKTVEDAAGEAADVLYFALVAATKKGVTLADIERQLDRRSLRVRRRAGNAKPKYIEKQTSPAPAIAPTTAEPNPQSADVVEDRGHLEKRARYF
eukprot:TRINITY_DN13700_c0_g1_i1.p1 TRINITY_DN13700_c0_g1~~TRINITY_DN13700_c0_g1_i1.p1  ORF type:complete len:535 (+),score=100.06 TRINITY_DN13700_c0_g1_i1:79-1605(+)